MLPPVWLDCVDTENMRYQFVGGEARDDDQISPVLKNRATPPTSQVALVGLVVVLLVVMLLVIDIEAIV